MGQGENNRNRSFDREEYHQRKKGNVLARKGLEKYKEGRIEQAMLFFQRSLKANFNINAFRELLLIAKKDFLFKKNIAKDRILQPHDPLFIKHKKGLGIIGFLIPFIKLISKLNQILEIVNIIYSLGIKEFNEALLERICYFIQNDAKECLIVIEYFLKRNKDIAKFYLLKYVQNFPSAKQDSRIIDIFNEIGIDCTDSNSVIVKNGDIKTSPVWNNGSLGVLSNDFQIIGLGDKTIRRK